MHVDFVIYGNIKVDDVDDAKKKILKALGLEEVEIEDYNFVENEEENIVDEDEDEDDVPA